MTRLLLLHSVFPSPSIPFPYPPPPHPADISHLVLPLRSPSFSSPVLCLSVFLSVSVSLSLSVCLSVCLSLSLSVCLSVFLSLSPPQYFVLFPAPLSSLSLPQMGCGVVEVYDEKGRRRQTRLRNLHEDVTLVCWVCHKP